MGLLHNQSIPAQTTSTADCVAQALSATLAGCLDAYHTLYCSVGPGMGSRCTPSSCGMVHADICEHPGSSHAWRQTSSTRFCAMEYVGVGLRLGCFWLVDVNVIDLAFAMAFWGQRRTGRHGLDAVSLFVLLQRYFCHS